MKTLTQRGSSLGSMGEVNGAPVQSVCRLVTSYIALVLGCVKGTILHNH